MRVSASIVPGFFTMANMFCGFLSALESSNGNFERASWLIIAAGVLDVLDGKLARLTQSDSHFGVQYDSMADVISFGLAPSTLAYFVFFHNWGAIGVFLSFIPLVFGAIRLARFNLLEDTGPITEFTGLPIPAAAATVATFVTFNLEIWEYFRWSKVLLSLMMIVALLMVSSIPFEKMPSFTLQGGRKNKLKIIWVVACLILIILFPEHVFFPLVMIYVLSGPARALWRLVRTRDGNNTSALNLEEETHES